MSVIESVRSARRPIRSPTAPSARLPIGRAKNPSAKMPSVWSCCAAGLLWGKNWRPMSVAK
jgi:hypothetical protein